MALETIKERTLEQVLPISGPVESAVKTAGGQIIAIARIRAVESPTPIWKFDRDLSYIHSFRLVNQGLKNGRNPNMISAMGPSGNLTVCMAILPEAGIASIRDAQLPFVSSRDSNFDMSPGGLVLGYMRAYNIHAEPTLGAPLVGIYQK